VVEGRALSARRRGGAALLIVLGAGCLALGLVRFSSARGPEAPAPDHGERTRSERREHTEGKPRALPSTPGATRPLASSAVPHAPVASTPEITLDAPVPTLLGAADGADPRSKQHIAFELGQRGDGEALEGLIALLGDADSEVRSVAAEQLERFEDERALDALNAALGSEDDDEVRALLREGVERLEASASPVSAPP